jgi:tetratricopeptide (TPR) repeat protein
LALGVEARRYFERAASLADDELERATLLADAGVAAARAADGEAARALLGDAIAVLDAGDRSEDAARTRVLLANLVIEENLLEEAGELLDQARPALHDEEALAEVAARRARVAFLRGDYARALSEADSALAIADRRRLWPLLAEAATTKANTFEQTSRLVEAEVLMKLGLQTALDHDVTEQALRGYFNLAEYDLITGRLREAEELLERGIQMARERGNRVWELDLVAQRIGVHAYCGEWDEALALGAAVSPGQTGPARLAAVFAPLILAARGDHAGLEQWLATPVGVSEWQELAVVETVARAVALRGLGRAKEAASAMAAAGPQLIDTGSLTQVYYAGEVIDALFDDGVDPRLAESLHAGSTTKAVTEAQIQRARALQQLRRGQLAEGEAMLAHAVARLRESGNPYICARALLDHATALLDVGQVSQPKSLLQEARSLFVQLGATPWVARTDAALTQLPAALNA